MKFTYTVEIHIDDNEQTLRAVITSADDSRQIKHLERRDEDTFTREIGRLILKDAWREFEYDPNFVPDAVSTDERFRRVTE